MLKQLVMTAVMGVLVASPAFAFDIEAMSAAEKEAFRAEIRAYLLSHPEVLLEAIAQLEEREANIQANVDTDLVHVNSNQIFNDGFSWVGGNPDGDITVVEFIDYRCGYCRRAHPEVSELITSDGNIRYIIKEFPILGEQSLFASAFALAVKQIEGDEAYAKVHDSLITMRAELTERSLSELSERFGFDTKAVLNAMSGEPVHDIIGQNRDLAQHLQIEGTPGFVFGDQIVRGYASLEQMREFVAEFRQKN